MVDAVETKLKPCQYLHMTIRKVIFTPEDFNKDVVVNKCNVKMQFIEKCSGIIIFTVFFMDKL